MQFAVLLMDDSTPKDEPSVELLKEEIEVDWDDHETESPDHPEEYVLRRFTERARDINTGDANVRVFISWFDNQGNIDFPHEFLELLVQKHWPLYLCLND